MSTQEAKPLDPSEIERIREIDDSFALPPLGLLKGRTAIVTGCSSGLGAATTRTFLEQGATVVGCHYSPADAQIYKADAIGEVESAARDYAGSFLHIDADIADEGTPKTLVDLALSGGRQIDVLCNLAGIANFTEFTDLTREKYERTLATNLTGPVFLTKEVVERMQQNPLNPLGSRGSIINMSSVTGTQIGEDGVLDYGLTKAAMHGFTLQLAADLWQYRIRTNTVAPGSIVTPINYRDFGDEQRRAAIERRTPLGRWGFPREIANTILFLASDMSSFLNGAFIIADGGLTTTFKLEE